MISLFLCKDDQYRGFRNRSGLVPWPPRSSDLIPMYFFVWREMKRLVYETPMNIEEELIGRVAAAAMVIFQTPTIFERTRQSLARTCHLFVEARGEQFQQRL